MSAKEKVLILDYDSRVTTFIDKKIRDFNVETVVKPWDYTFSDSKEKFSCIILIASNNFHHNHIISQSVFDLNVPILAISYATFLLAKHFGFTLEKSDPSLNQGLISREFVKNSIFEGLEKIELQINHYPEIITELDGDFQCLLKNEKEILAFEKTSSRIYGMQLNPLFDFSFSLDKILENFILKIVNAEQVFSLKEKIDRVIERTKTEIPSNSKVLVLLSGGVDSLVNAILLSKVIGKENIIGVHIDSGLLRESESTKVLEEMANFGLKVNFIKANLEFQSSTTNHIVRVDTMKNGILVKEANQDKGKGLDIDSLCVEVRNIPIGPLNESVTCPEQKKLIIRDTFLRIAERVWKEMDTAQEPLLVSLSTLRSDLIENQMKSSYRFERSDYMKKQKRFIEPLIEFYKDEVRLIGKDLGLPEAFLQRLPFPQYGLSTRIICATEAHFDKDYQETTSLIKMIAGFNAMSKRPHPLLSRIKATLTEEECVTLTNVTADKKLSAHLLPIKSSSLPGQMKSASYICALSTSNDRPDWESLEIFARLIPKISHKINRVVFVLGNQVNFPINDITVTFLRKPTIDCLREIDHEVIKILQTLDNNPITMLPIILLPIHFDREPTQCNFNTSILRSVVLRPFISKDFIKGNVPIPGRDIPEEIILKMEESISKMPGISRVLYDLTSYPPGFIEWE